MEEWRPVLGYEGVYEISSQGQVRRVLATQGARAGQVLRRSVDGRGYHYVELTYGGKATRKRRPVHQLVAEAFIGEGASGQEVNHEDGDPRNNRPGNLTWGTHTDNMRHAARIGRLGKREYARGERHHRSKLTDEERAEIRALRGKTRQVDLAARFGISQAHVSLVQRSEA
jgi:hypothetical protein